MSDNNEIKEKMKTAKKNQESRLQAFVGRKVKMEIIDREYIIAGKPKLYPHYKMIDSEFEQEIASLSSDYRIFPPGTAGTMDYQPGRLNVYINKECLVDSVSFG